MNDLISRQAAIKAIEDLQDCYNGFSDTYDKACLIGVIEEVPTIEAVPLEDYQSMEQTVHKLTQAIAEAEPRVVTNADNLRSIQNDMQLALFMTSVDACPYDRDDAFSKCEKWNGDCVSCWLYWLKQKVDDEVEE